MRGERAWCDGVGGRKGGEREEGTAHLYGVVMTLRESDNEFGREHKGQYIYTRMWGRKHTQRDAQHTYPSPHTLRCAKVSKQPQLDGTKQAIQSPRAITT